ncbi:flagellar assembly factor FliW [Jatrophihabitans sp. GAS493]|uniref:flagellar assembly protein FliW n=1 Tax=Jatrophihabitans sp. GAS493 TaxID=1907575 RepID=UPI000BC051CA|nr:flagellar assembly protein FliW [Jatrophihabitans sp. GAS493]SOD71353.1 flagellar assembly factor FliW [Jatrophihabitans sp. GAS493]
MSHEVSHGDPADFTGSASALTLVEFAEPIAGFPNEQIYTLSTIDDAGAFFSLRAAASPELRFILTPPALFFPQYAPKLDETLLSTIGAPDESDVLLFAILTVQKSISDATANLRAPIALCRSTGRAVQVVLDDESLSFREAIDR